MLQGRVIWHCHQHHFTFIIFFGGGVFLGPDPGHMEVPRLGGGIGAATAGLHRSHGNAGSGPRLQPIPPVTATPDPQPIPRVWMSETKRSEFLTRAGIEPTSSWILVGFISTAPHWGLPQIFPLKLHEITSVCLFKLQSCGIILYLVVSK